MGFLTGIADKLSLGDALWQIAASDAVIFGLSFLILVCVVVGHFPILSKLSALQPYVIPAQCLVFVFLAIQGFLVGYRYADGRAEAKALRAQIEYSDEIIANKNFDLHLALEAAETMQTQRDEAAQRAKTAQDKIDEYAKGLPTSGADDCRITADDLAFGLQDH